MNSVHSLLKTGLKTARQENIRQLKFRKLLNLPESQAKDVVEQSETLDTILKDSDKEYLGTDPLDDCTRLYRQH